MTKKWFDRGCQPHHLWPPDLQREVHEISKPLPEVCPRVPTSLPKDEPLRCCIPKILDDGKRHSCQKRATHSDGVHACWCWQEWRQFEPREPKVK